MLGRWIVIGFGLAIMFPALVFHGVTSAYPAPKRTQFFPAFEAPLPPTATTEERQARTELQQQRQHAFDEASRRFARVLLVTATALGVSAILLGAAVTLPSISAGLMLGGIFAVGIGWWWYSAVDDWWRFTSLLAGFLALLLVGQRYKRVA